MKTLSVRDLSRKTASVLNSLERGETYELRRNGKAVGYLSHTPPSPERKPDWDAHFARLARQKSSGLVKELEADRARMRTRENALDKLV